jgi:MFS family permease
MVAFAYCTAFWTALICLASAGFFEQVFGVTNQTLLQLSIPDKLRGRVTSVLNLSRAISPIGAMIAGAGSDYFGTPRTITIIMGLTAAIVAIFVLIFSPTVRNYKLSQSIQSPD